MTQILRGRVREILPERVRIDTGGGSGCWVEAEIGAAGLGDWVVLESPRDGGPAHLRVLTPNRRPGRSLRLFDRINDPRRRKGVAMRARVESLIREFFAERDFLETRTPLLVPCPGMEPHIRPFRLETGATLPTSPEFALKRLLVGGLERIFEITPALDRKSTRLNSSHVSESRMPSSA